MAYSFPLSVTDFMRALPIAEISFDAPEQIEVNQTAGGEIITGDLGPMLWQGDVRLGTMTHAEASHADVMLDLLRPAGRMFYAYDTRRPAPLADPAGLAATLDALASPPVLAEASATAWRLGRERYNWEREQDVLLQSVAAAFARRETVR